MSPDATIDAVSSRRKSSRSPPQPPRCVPTVSRKSDWARGRRSGRPRGRTGPARAGSRPVGLASSASETGVTGALVVQPRCADQVPVDPDEAGGSEVMGHQVGRQQVIPRHASASATSRQERGRSPTPQTALEVTLRVEAHRPAVPGEGMASWGTGSGSSSRPASARHRQAPDCAPTAVRSLRSRSSQEFSHAPPWAAGPPPAIPPRPGPCCLTRRLGTVAWLPTIRNGPRGRRCCPTRSATPSGSVKNRPVAPAPDGHRSVSARSV